MTMTLHRCLAFSRRPDAEVPSGARTAAQALAKTTMNGGRR
jgi:hypothetical protein